MSSETTKHEHDWCRPGDEDYDRLRDGDGDFCRGCGVKWIDWTRGFDSNVRAFKRKPEPLVRPISG